MKINEVLSEGPVWDQFKQAGRQVLDKTKQVAAATGAGARGAAQAPALVKSQDRDFGTTTPLSTKLAAPFALGVHDAAAAWKDQGLVNQQAKAQREGGKQLKDSVDATFARWNEYSAKIGGASRDQFQNWASKWFRADPGVLQLPTDLGPAGMYNYLKFLTQQYYAGSLPPIPTPPQAQQAAPANVSAAQVVADLEQKYPNLVNDIAALLLQKKASGIAR